MCIRLSIDCLGSIKISLMIFLLKLIREFYGVRIRTDINFLLFRVSFFVVSDFILLVVSSDLSNFCFENFFCHVVNFMFSSYYFREKFQQFVCV